MIGRKPEYLDEIVPEFRMVIWIDQNHPLLIDIPFTTYIRLCSHCTN